MALPKLSTGALNIYADPHLGSEISPTTSPAASSKQEDSDPNYTLNYEEPDNYSQTEVDRYISRSFTGKRKTVIKYSIKFDLVTAEGEAIHFEFEDTKDEPELYVPLVKFCKDKGTSAVLKRYPNTEIVEDFQVK